MSATPFKKKLLEGEISSAHMTLVFADDGTLAWSTYWASGEDRSMKEKAERMGRGVWCFEDGRILISIHGAEAGSQAVCSEATLEGDRLVFSTGPVGEGSQWVMVREQQEVN